MRQYFALTILMSTIALGACGTRGSLTLPPPRSKAPAPPTSANAPAKSAPDDLNTATEALR